MYACIIIERRTTYSIYSNINKIHGKTPDMKSYTSHTKPWSTVSSNSKIRPTGTTKCSISLLSNYWDLADCKPLQSTPLIKRSLLHPSDYTHIYIYIYMRVHMCICMRIHACAYIYIYIERERDHIYIYIYIYIYHIYIYIFILCTEVYIISYIYIYVQICIIMCIYIYVHITVCVCADMQQNSFVSIATLSARLVKNFLPQNRKDVRLKSSRGQDLCQSPYTGLLMGIHMIVHMNVYDQAV